MGATVSIRNQFLDRVFNDTAFTTSFTTLNVSLHTADPGDNGANEVSGGSYARQTGSFAAAASGSCSTDTQLEFTNMPAVTVSHVGVWNGATTPVFLWGGPLDTSRTIEAGDTAIIPSGDLTASVT